MITLKQLKRLNIISWIPVVNFFVVNVYMWDKLRRHKVFTKKQVAISALFLIAFVMVYAVLREWIVVGLYDLVPEQWHLFIALVDSWCFLIVPVRSAYYDIKKAYKKQVDNKVKMAVCPICKYEQPVTRTVCWNCGAEIPREVEQTQDDSSLC